MSCQRLEDHKVIRLLDIQYPIHWSSPCRGVDNWRQCRVDRMLSPILFVWQSNSIVVTFQWFPHIHCHWWSQDVCQVIWVQVYSLEKWKWPIHWHLVPSYTLWHLPHFHTLTTIVGSTISTPDSTSKPSKRFLIYWIHAPWVQNKDTCLYLFTSVFCVSLPFDQQNPRVSTCCWSDPFASTIKCPLTASW